MKHKEGSKDWWIEKYQNSADYLYGKAPSEFLVSHHEHLNRGDVLDIGIGEGRNAVYLAGKNFNVKGIDFCEIALERAARLAKESGVNIEIKQQDLDFLLLPIMSCDNILVIDTKPPLTLLKGLARGLKKGGIVLIENYLTTQIGQKGYQPDPTECFKPGELLEYVRDLHVLYYSELPADNQPRKVRLIARK